MKIVVYPITIKSSADARILSEVSAEADLGVTVSYGTVILDPRSILGLLTLVGKRVLLVAPDHSNPNEFWRLISKLPNE